jgi:copper ion binding protein
MSKTLERSTTMITTMYRVEGMTCSHCVNSVSSEVGALPGVRAVDVDLETGAVTVTSEKPLDTDAVRGAVDEAGYELVG